VQRRNLQRRASAAFCTSTPRKRYINIVQSEPSIIIHSNEQEKGGTPHLSNAEVQAMTNGQVRRLSICRRGSVDSTSSSSVAGSYKCNKSSRGSFCMHGGMFADTRSRKLRKKNQQQQRQKMRQKRFGCFDQARILSVQDSEWEEDDVPVSSIEGQVRPLSSQNSEWEDDDMLVLDEYLSDYALHNDNNNNNDPKYSLMVRDCTLQFGNLTLGEFETKVEPTLEQSLDVAATFNIASTMATNIVPGTTWTEEQQQPLLLKALDAKEEETSMILQNQEEEEEVSTRLTETETETTDSLALRLMNAPTISLSVNNLTDTTTASWTTNASSRRSWTTHSVGHITSPRLPRITVTTMRDTYTPPIPNHNQMNVCRRCHRITLNHFIVLGILSILFLMSIYFQFYDWMSLGIILGLIILLIAIYFSSK